MLIASNFGIVATVNGKTVVKAPDWFYVHRLGTTAHWLRWWDVSGNLLLWSSEKSTQEHQRAEILANKLRELGIDPDTLTS
jgi:hypothetical protein